MRGMIRAVALATLLATTAAAQDRPQHQGWLADGAGLLAAEEAAAIRSSISTTREVTGVTVAVLTLQASGGVDPKTISVNTLNDWNPGTKSVILLVCMSPRKIYVQPGIDLVSTLNESAATSIARDVMAPDMKAGRPFRAIQAGIDAVRLRILPPEAPASQAQPVQAQTSADSWSTGAILGIVAAVMMAVLVVTLAATAAKAEKLNYESSCVATKTPEPSRPPTAPMVFLPPPAVSKPKKRTEPRRHSPPPPPARSSYDDSSSYFPWSGGGGSESSSSSSSSSSYDSGSASSFDFGGGISCDGGGGGGADF